MASQRVFIPSRLPLWRIAATVLVVICSLLAGLTPAVAASIPRAYAGIVVDAKSGKVLYESDADAYRFPASVSKVMTLYVLFQELKAGNIKLSDKMPVSKFAASAVPTKLGLKPGSSITVENAIKSIVTLSANDMARVVAEYISGSESAFGKRMTSTARALGMKHTTYVNASGLPDSRQITTVRDQAVLALAIYEHFPKYYAYFQTKSFSYGKRTYGNHNNLLGNNGVDGIKTGYTGAAGYNLMTAARTDGRHIVVVGFGFNSGAKRDAKVRELVKTYLPKARSGDYLQTAMIPAPGRKGSVVASESVQVAITTPIVPMPAPIFRSLEDSEAESVPEIGIGDFDGEVSVASIAPAPVPIEVRPVDLQMPEAIVENSVKAASRRPQVTDVIGDWLSDNYSLGAAPAPLGFTQPSAPLVPPVGVGKAGQPIDLMTSGSIAGEPVETQVAEKAPEQPLPAALPEGWIVQIGAAPTETGATGLLDNAAGKIATLGKFQPFVQRFEKDGQTYFRARFGGFSGQGAANDMCKQLKQAKMSCLAMQS